jgi:hypothetical protein
MVAYGEDVEVDFMRLYHEVRLNARWYEPSPGGGKGRDIQKTAELKIARDPDGIPLLDEEGLPKHVVVIPDSEELKAMQKLYNLRNFGLRYAYTVAKTRILKVASGIRTLPVDSPRGVRVKVYGFRDNLTPEQRIEKSQRDQTAIFGRSITEGRKSEETALSDEEMAAVAIEEGDDTVIEHAAKTESEGWTPEDIDEVLQT